MVAQQGARVLIGVPTFAGHAWCRGEFERHLQQAASTGNADVLVAWNGAGPAGFEGHEVIQYEPGAPVETGAQILARKQDLLRKHALDGGYSHLLLLESDVMPPADVIPRLLEAGAAVASALYFVKARDETVKPLTNDQRAMLAARGAPDTAIALQRRERTVPCVFAASHAAGDAPGTSARLWDLDDWLRERLAGTRRTRLVRGGLGCALVRRDVLAAIPFRLPADAGSRFSDYYFYLDVHRAGYTAFVDLECLALHVQPDSVHAGRNERWFTARGHGPGS